MATMNKLILATVLTGLLLSSCQSDKVKSENVDSSMVDPKNPPVIKFEESVYDFGTISQGEKVKHTYFFKNTGKSPLIIHSAQGSCGCTIPEYPKKPILPGEEGVIDVVFASEGKSGIVEKSVTIVTNCEPSTKIIYIKANIIVPTSANASELPTAH